MTIERNDPLLTAYALGELEGDEAAAIAAAVAETPGLGALVEEIRRAGDLVREALRLEGTPELTGEQRASVQKPRRASIPFRLRERTRHWSTVQKLAAVLIVGLGLWGTWSQVVGPYVFYSSSYMGYWLSAVGDSTSSDSAARMAFDVPAYSDDLPHNRLRRALGLGDNSVAQGTGGVGDSDGSAQVAVGSNPASTPELPLSLSMTSVSYWQQLQATAPPPPRTGGALSASSSAPLPEPLPDNRMIIKNAALSLEVGSVPIALSRLDAIAAETGGYVTETRTEYASADQEVKGAAPDNAVIGFSVPVTRFEAAMTRIRDVGLVLSESASGTDVSQDFVDTQSQVANLEATQARVRAFLDQAKSVEEALRVNSELTQIEGQISELKGRLQYLAGRAAFSTITVEVHEAVPDATPTPTATQTPTPTPTPTATPAFNPGKTAHAAFGTLKGLAAVVATGLIWIVIVVLPVIAVFALVYWVVRELDRRRRRKDD